MHHIANHIVDLLLGDKLHMEIYQVYPVTIHNNWISSLYFAQNDFKISLLFVYDHKECDFISFQLYTLSNLLSKSKTCFTGLPSTCSPCKYMHAHV